jgi:hypothetical protein
LADPVPYTSHSSSTSAFLKSNITWLGGLI